MNIDKKKNILIVDDDPFLQGLYRKTLEREGFNILTAADGQEAVEMLPNICADLVVLDLMLPKISGLKVLETIRADSHHKDLPVLILSNAYLPDTAQKAMQATATAGMLKSECSPKELVKIIRETLKQANAETVKLAGETGKQSARGSWFSNLLGSKSEDSSPADAGAKTAELVRTATSKSESSESGTSASSVEVQSELLKSWPTDIAMLREIGLKYVKTVGTQESEEHLKNLYRRLRLLGARATIGELGGISQLSNALEAMLFEHGFNIKRSMSPSVLQTMVQAMDCVEFLFKTGRTTKRQMTRKSRILLVDDDPVCNLANELALKRASFETVCVGDGNAALETLQNKHCDLILLDVNMPEINGFDVCKKIRLLPRYKEVPVIFVTINDDFQSRAQGVLSGSNGLITKPISPLELIVKALVFLLRAEDANAAKGMSLAGQLGGKNQAVTGDQTTTFIGAPAQNEGRVKELKATQAAVEDRVKTLTHALATETKRREEAEQQAVANIKLQTRLETAKVDNQNADDYFERMLVESKQQAQNSQGNEAWKLEGRNRALESVRSFVQDKVRNLTEVIEVQAKKSEAAKKEVAEYAQRKREMGIALAEIEQAKNNLMKEIEAAGNGKLRGDLELALAKNEKSQAKLLQKLESNRQVFELQQKAGDGEPTKSEGWKPDAASEAQVKALNEALVEEKRRCKLAEQQAIEISGRRSALEAELVESNRAQDRLRDALAEQQQRLASQMETQNVELGNIADRTKELTAAQTALAELNDRHANAAGQVQSLTEELVAESSRRTSVEREAAELLARRAELEQELAQYTQAQEQLRDELAEKQRLLDEQVQLQNVQSCNVTEQAKELAAARAALAELQTRHENAAGQVQSLTESLTVESGRRTTVEQQTAELMTRRAELENDLAQRSQAQERLRAELAEKQQLLDAQVQTHNVELSTRTQALEGERATMEAKVKELVQALVAEKERSKNAELQAAGISQQRGTLEMELAQSHQMQEQLRAQLAEQQQRLDAQVQKHNVELGNFSSRVQELEAAQVALAELKARHLGATEQVQALNESLATESNRRATAELTAAELAARRAELEEELARRTQIQEQLQAEFSEQQQQLDAQVQTHNVELGNFNERLHELESTQTALADLKARHQDVAGQVQALTESLKSEADRRMAAEQTAVELGARRAELEKELVQRTQTQEQLQAELAKQKQRLDAQVQSHNVELENFEAQTKELDSTRTALMELMAQHAEVNGQVHSLTETLAVESGRRESAEKQSAELVGRRAELEQELSRQTKSQGQLRTELTEQHKRLDAEIQAHNIEVKKFEARVQELAVAQTALAELEAQHADVNEQVQVLNKSLTTESDRREDAEKQVVKLIAQRIEMEKDIAHRALTQSKLRAQLAEQKQRLEAEVQLHGAEQGRLMERTKELEMVQASLAELQSRHTDVTKQVAALTESLKSETDRRTSAERQSVELAACRAELENELARRTQTQEQLRTELAEKQQRWEAQVFTHNVELGKLTERTQELAAAQAALAELKSQHAAVTEQVKLLTRQAQSLTESLQAESGHRTAAEQEAAKLSARRTELEQELAQRTKSQNTLSTELTEQQQRLAAQVEAHQLEVKKHETQVKELTAVQGTLAKLQTQHTDVTEQVRSLTESLKTETGRREDCEQQVARLTAQRVELEQSIVQHTQTQTQLRAELLTQQQCLDAQVQTHNVELGNLAERTQELAAAQTALAELKSQHARVTEKAQSLATSLAAESSQRETAEENLAELQVLRTDLEKELSQCTQTQEQLHGELGEKQRQMDAIAAELAEVRQRTETEAVQLAGQFSQSEQVRMELGRQLNNAQELIVTREADMRLLESELQKQRGEHARVDRLFQAETVQCRRLEAQIEAVQSQLNETSAHLARKCAAELVWLGRESELQECARNQRNELTKASATLAIQTAEIESARTKITDFETHHSALIGQIQELTNQGQTLTGSLTVESGRREMVEKNLANLNVRRAELEQEIANRVHAQEQLRSQLAEKVQAHNIEIANLATRTKELEVAHAELAELHAWHDDATSEVQSLTTSLTAETNRREVAEQVWLGRESELQNCIRSQEGELAMSSANLAGQTVEIKNAQKTIEELQVLQSALCVQIQNLTKQGETTAKFIQELQANVVRSEKVARNGGKKLAGLRYAVLEAARMNARLRRERLHKDRQDQDALRRLVSSLAQTPLSLAQRGMLAELQHSMDNLKNLRVGALDRASYPVEFPSLRRSQFSFAEITESAFQAVWTAATAAGVTVQASTSGSIPHQLIGCMEHIHQLITLLAISPITIATGVNALDLRMAIKPLCERYAEINFCVSFSSDGDAQELLRRLTLVTAAASHLQTGSFNEAEIGLAAGWQLAEALGAETVLEMDAGKQVCLVLSLAIEMDAQPVMMPIEEALVYVPSLNGSGHGNSNGHHYRNGNGKVNGNGYHLIEARAEFAD